MFDKRLDEAIRHFNIEKPEDWAKIAPDEIRAIQNFGPVFVNYLRLHLANRGLTLLNDETPLHWQNTLSVKRGVMQLSVADGAVLSDFTVLIDSAEKLPFTFQGLRSDANQKHRPLVVKTRRQHLGVSRGDYSIDGLEGFVHIERKSCDDAISTVLGWGERREQFQETLRFLSNIPSSCIVVECDRDALLEAVDSRGRKTIYENQKILNRQIMAWEEDYRVPWIFSRDRRRAEVRAFLWLQRAYRHKQEADKASMRTA